MVEFEDDRRTGQFFSRPAFSPLWINLWTLPSDTRGGVAIGHATSL
jgi:hypothetical protein